MLPSTITNYRKTNRKESRYDFKFKRQLHTEVLENPEYFFGGLSRVGKEILEYFIWASKNHHCIAPTQSFIAKKVRSSRSHVNRIINKLAYLGIIKKTYRHLTSCIYELGLFLSNHFNLTRLASIFTYIGYYNKKSTQYKYYIDMYIYKYLVNKKTKGKAMNSDQISSPFSKRLEKAAEEVNLTLRGMIALCPFTDDVIEYAVSILKIKLKSRKLIGDYGPWLCSVANKHCAGLGLTPNWKYKGELTRLYGDSIGEAYTDWEKTRKDKFKRDREKKEGSHLEKKKKSTFSEKKTNNSKPIGSVDTGLYKVHVFEEETKEDPSLFEKKIKEAIKSSKENQGANIYLKMLLNP